MADASSASPQTTAAQLREAAKQTMRRKQAPTLRPPIPPTRNGPNVSSSSHSSSAAPSSATPSPIKAPKGPRGAPSLPATNTVPLNYGDPNDSSTLDAPRFPGGAALSGASGTSEPRRVSATRARLSAGKGEDGPEEGEISDEETRAKRRERARSESHDKSTFILAALQPPPVPVNHSGSTLMSHNVPDGSSPVIPTSGPAEATNDGDAATKGKRLNSLGGMHPPPPPANVHREPAPISPTASTPATQAQPIGKTLADIGKLGDEPTHDPPRRQSHRASSVDIPPPRTPPNLSTNNKGPSKYEYANDVSYLGGQAEEEEETSELSPKTEHMNQEVFGHLVQLGVDEDHCRPGLPMTFQQFNAAKKLILDLLGYGMTPEHIADIGLNRRLLVYCLRELKIRLPANVPVDDIVMFDPPFDATAGRPSEDSEASSALHSPRNDDLQSPTSMEITPVDGLIVETVSGSPSASPSPTPPAASDSKSPSPPPRHPLPPAPKLNIHAEPFLPAKPPPQTTGPSLFAIALPFQQIAAMPQREPPAVVTTLPHSLPRRPVSSYDAASSRRSTAGSSSAATVVAFSAGMDTEMEPPPQDPDLLQRLEQEKKLLLQQTLQLRKKGGLTLSTSDRPGSAPPQSALAKVTPDVEPQHKSSILGGERVGSPSPMDVDTPISQTPAAPNVHAPVAVPPNPIAMPKRPPVIRAPLGRSMTSTESTRPSTPSDAGPKRGVKRPKADDFVEDNQPAKKSARLNGAVNMPPLKRSSFAIANSAPPEQHIITWIDDENVEMPNPSSWNQSRDHSNANGARDHEAAQLAAAAMAIGLPMTTEELEAARMQEEERKAQLNVKAAKLLQIQANLKRLELKKAEKKLLTLQSTGDQSAVSEQILVVQTLKQELETIEVKLPSSHPMPTMKAGAKDTPPTENPGASTSETPVTQLEPFLSQEQGPEASIPEPSTYPASSPSATENEDWDMLKDDDSDIVILDEASAAAADRPPEEEVLPGPDAAHEILHHEAASQSRLTPYSPPLMLSVLTAHHKPSDPVTYSTGDDESSRTTNLLLPAQPNPSTSRPSTDPGRILCQFEFGGGVCRDPGCQDLHFKDLPA